MSLNDLYTKEWMEAVAATERHSSVVIADTIARHIKPKVALDIGCGPCGVINALRKRRCDAAGVDGSSHALDFADPGTPVHIHDLTRALDLRLQVDVVICMEVLEHLPAHTADIACHTIARHAKDWLVFSAAPPGQPGHHHVNLMPADHWIGHFERRGFQLQTTVMQRWVRDWRSKGVVHYFCDNLLVFRRAGQAGPPQRGRRQPARTRRAR